MARRDDTSLLCTDGQPPASLLLKCSSVGMVAVIATMTAPGHKRERRPRRRPASDAAGVPQLADSLLAGREGSALGPGRVKTRSDLVVMPCGARIFAFIRSPSAHTPQKSWCAFTAQSFHTAWATSGHSAAAATWASLSFHPPARLK